MGLDSAGDQPSRGFGLPGTPVTTEVGAIELNRPRAVRVNRPYLFLSAQYDHTMNPITRHRVLLQQRALRCHRRPIEIVVEQPIPTRKVGISIDFHQLVSIPVSVGYSIEPSRKLEAMQN